MRLVRVVTVCGVEINCYCVTVLLWHKRFSHTSWLGGQGSVQAAGGAHTERRSARHSSAHSLTRLTSHANLQIRRLSSTRTSHLSFTTIVSQQTHHYISQWVLTPTIYHSALIKLSWNVDIWDSQYTTQFSVFGVMFCNLASTYRAFIISNPSLHSPRPCGRWKETCQSSSPQTRPCPPLLL